MGMIGLGVGGKFGCGFDGGCRGEWCASEGWGGWCEVIVGDGVLGGGLLLEFYFPRSINKIKFFNQISTSI